MKGSVAELLFYQRLEELGESPAFSSKDENMFHHIDIKSNNVTYDVKTVKAIRRGDKLLSEIIWLEMRNVRGNKGWLLGDADKIAFFDGAKFDIVDREKLLEFTREFVGTSDELPVLGDPPKYKTLYRRSSRPAELTAYIFRSDIKHLIEKQV